jgi:hypothetical protein
MTLLTTITNEAVNENLSKRWKNGEIYTFIGGVLISVNPFRGALDLTLLFNLFSVFERLQPWWKNSLQTALFPDLGIYTDDVLSKYKGKNRLEVPPHVFSIAETAYYNMNAYHENQCVIISGESGAGKTEAAKRIMQYIAAVSGGKDSSIQEIKDMVLATNPLLESFGCAKTLRNNNSSRHVRFCFYVRGASVSSDTHALTSRGNTSKSCLMTTENQSGPKSQITCSRRAVWSDRSRMRGTSMSFTSLQRQQVTNNGVSPPTHHFRAIPTILQRHSAFKGQRLTLIPV